MLKSIDYKRNNKTEVIKINLKKINYIYGANGTGKTTTSTGYANRESEGIYTFNQEFINNNLFSPSPINGTMNKDQSKKFTEIMFGSDLVEIQREIQSIDSYITKLDNDKELLNKTDLPSEFINKLKDSTHTSNYANYNFGTVIKNQDIILKIDTFTKENKLFDINDKTHIHKIANLFFYKEDNIENYIKNKSNELFVNAIRNFNSFANDIYQKILEDQKKIISEVKKFNILIKKFNDEKIKHEKIDSREFEAINFVLEKSKKECYVCKNKGFTPNSHLYKEWDTKINNKFFKIKKNISKFIDEVSKMIIDYNTFINNSEDSFQKNQEVIVMNEKTNKLQGIFTKMKKSLEENSSLEVFKKINEIKSIGEPEVFKDNLFDILLQNFKEELNNYLNIVIQRNSASSNKTKLKKEMEAFEPMEQESFNFIKETLKNLDFAYDIKLEKVSGSLTDMGINAQKIIIDGNREVHELSAGERNTLALSFFISIIYNSIKLKKQITTIMIDDPVDSNDSGKVGLVIQEFKNLGNKLFEKKYIDVQWVYLTHNSDFLFASIDPKRAKELKIINFYSSNPWFIEIESEKDIAGFLISNEKFLWNVINNFIDNKNDNTFIRAFCVLPKYAEIIGNLTGVKHPKKYKKILDYDKHKSESFSYAEFIEYCNCITGKKINSEKSKIKDLDIIKIREFYRELDNWKPKDNYIEDLIEKNIRYIASATFYTIEESNDKNRTNRKVLRHDGSAYRNIFFINQKL